MTNDWSLPHRPSLPSRIFYSIYRERWVFLLTLAVLIGAGSFLIRLPRNVYASYATLLIQYPRSTQRLSSPTETGVGELSAIGDRSNPISNQVAILQSAPLYEDALQRLNLTHEEAPHGALSVDAIGGTDLVRVTYQSESPELAAAVVQAVTDAYIEQNLETNREQGETAREFVEERLPALRRRMEDARTRLEQFQTANRFLGTAVETDAIAASLNDFASRVALAQAELAATQQRSGQLRAQIPGDPLTVLNASGVNQDPVYQDLQSQLATAETELVELRNRFTDEDLHVISALERRNELEALLNQRAQTLLGGQSFGGAIDPVRQRLVEQWFGLEAERAAQAAQLNQLAQQLGRLQVRSGQFPQLMRQQMQLQMALTLAEQEYLTFQERYTSSRIASEQTISNVRIVDPATVNDNPISPNRKLLLALLVVGSTTVALGIVWLLRQRDNSLNQTSDLQELLPLPILATVPWMGDGRLNQEEPLDVQPLAHNYRLLQAHLKMLPQEMRVIAICSWMPGEGRSSVANNLAFLEAKSGYDVLLIDAHRFLPNHPSPTPWQAAPQKVLPKLDVLPNSGMCSASNYKEWMVLLEQARNRYDLVVVDCPPTVQGADAALLASLADGVLWVVCPDMLGRQGVKAATQNLRTWGARLLGQVVVGVENGTPPAMPRQAHASVAGLMQEGGYAV